MPFAFQYNKTELNELGKRLKMRQAALPVLKNKESALRAEVALHRRAWQKLDAELKSLQQEAEALLPLLGAFPLELLRVEPPKLGHRKIAGVRIPLYGEFALELQPALWHEMPQTHRDVLAYLQRLARAVVEERIAREELAILERERKRATQKVNLYEKVQIPQIEDALKKIKRYLEDEQNLAKSAQKMVKARKLSP